MTDKCQSFVPSQDNTRALRDAFGCFGTGVTVVTATTSDGPLGMTANSFSSISLDPALVLWAPAKNSKRHDAFISAREFCIHVLSADQLDMAQHFASEGKDFSPFASDTGPTGAPRLLGCLAEFHCCTHAVHPAGDHSLVLGRVQHVVHTISDKPGLVFAKGQFGRFSSATP
ncbi:MAG: flavin reductase family protein [Roseobacter sp.]|jgi:flavin reductase (DIM6/NTAB) family NADH-FMN oxidoreductase RutF